MRHINYWERLSHPKLFSLERRKRYIIISVWKMISWYCSKYRNHNKTSPKTWQIPKNIRNGENVTENCFENQLDEFLKSVPRSVLFVLFTIQVPCLPLYYKSAGNKCIVDLMHVMPLKPASHTATGSGPSLK